MKSQRERFNFGDAKFVGLAGALGAGKDTGADHLAEEHGFMHVSTSNMLREVARNHCLDTDRDTLINLGIQLRLDYGTQGALIIKAMEKWHMERSRYAGGLVVTAMRAVGEAQEIVEHGGTLVFVDAPVELGYQRMLARMRDDETAKTFEEFADHARMEMDGDPNDPKRPNLRAIKNIAHHVLMNKFEEPEPYFDELDKTLGLRHA